MRTVLLLMYINELDTGLNSSLFKLADSKVGEKSLMTTDCKVTQNDRDQIIQRSKTSKFLSLLICINSLHLGAINVNHGHYMTLHGKTLKVVPEESDFRVTVSINLKHATHYELVYK